MTWPQTIKATKFLYWALAIHSLGIVTKMLFEPWDGLDGGGGVGAAILPVTFIFLLFNAFLAWVVNQISKNKNWARLTITVLFIPWNILFLIGGGLSISLSLHLIATILAILSLIFLFSKNPNRSFAK